MTTALPPEVLRLTPVQKERLRSNEILIELQDPGTDLHETEKVFGTLEKLIGERAANRIGAILASTEYGLSETEILEVVMPTGGDGPLALNDGFFNFSTWCLVKRTFNEFLKATTFLTLFFLIFEQFFGKIFREIHTNENSTFLRELLKLYFGIIINCSLVVCRRA